MANFTLSKTTGTGSDTIGITTNVNYGRNSKTGTVTITSKIDPAIKATVSLNQSGNANYWIVVTAPNIAPAVRSMSDPASKDVFDSVGLFKTNINSYYMAFDTAKSSRNLIGRLSKLKLEFSNDQSNWTTVYDSAQSGLTTGITIADLASASEFAKKYSAFGGTTFYFVRYTVSFKENTADAAKADLAVNFMLGDKTTKVGDAVFAQAGYSGAISLSVDSSSKTLAATATTANIALTSNAGWNATVV